jgi:cytochrome c oxidase cbb3-type subunit IV
MSGFASGVATVLAFIAFIAVVFWAYSSKRKADFERLASLPLDDREPSSAQAKSIEERQL